MDMANYCVPQKGTAALLTLSAQQDFVCPQSPYRASGIQRVKPALRHLAQGFRAQGAPLFHAVRLYRPDGSNVDACRRQAVEEGLRVFMPGTLGAELLDEVKPEASVRLDPSRLMDGRFQKLGPGEWAFYRPRWGAFHGTALEARLAQHGVTTLVICGFSFATAMRATIYEASARDFRIIVATDAVGNASEEGLRELGRIGVYLMSAESCLDWQAGSDGSSAAA
jgi:nicotinamidase-related amidase